MLAVADPCCAPTRSSGGEAGGAPGACTASRLRRRGAGGPRGGGGSRARRGLASRSAGPGLEGRGPRERAEGARARAALLLEGRFEAGSAGRALWRLPCGRKRGCAVGQVASDGERGSEGLARGFPHQQTETVESRPRRGRLALGAAGEPAWEVPARAPARGCRRGGPEGRTRAFTPCSLQDAVRGVQLLVLRLWPRSFVKRSV